MTRGRIAGARHEEGFMLLRSMLAVLGLCSVFALWAIAVSADDARQGIAGPQLSLSEADSGY